MSFSPFPSRLRTLAVATVAGLALVGCDAPEEEAAPSPPSPVVTSAPTATTTSTTAPTTTTADPTTDGGAAPADPSAMSAALAQLETLPVKGRAPRTGYSRDQFGPAWTDDVRVEFGGNGCDTRNDILRRDLVDIVFRPGTRDCTVESGILHDAYTGKTIEFTRGPDTSSAVQIDHIVALSDAWQKGAQQLDAGTRIDLANDPRNLQAVDGPTNQQKSDGDAATWLPPNRAYRCTYVARQIEVKAIYGLWVTQAEHDAMVRVLTDCGAATPAVAVPTTTVRSTTLTAPSPVPVPPAPAPVPAATTQPPAPAPAPAPEGEYYPNCKAARAAGAAPLYAGQPGYRAKLDGDGDGIACE